MDQRKQDGNRENNKGKAVHKAAADQVDEDDDRDDSHRSMALGTGEGVHLIDFLSALPSFCAALLKNRAISGPVFLQLTRHLAGQKPQPLFKSAMIPFYLPIGLGTVKYGKISRPIHLPGQYHSPRTALHQPRRILSASPHHQAAPPLDPVC
jgi:hypothetical protein